MRSRPAGEMPMAFVALSGFPGKVYAPEPLAAEEKKHTCPDCYACQMCSDDRCAVCRGEGSGCNGECLKEKPGKEETID